jgi:hypothetical protein
VVPWICFCGPLDMFSDLTSVGRAIKKRSQVEHVQRALENSNSRVRRLASFFIEYILP